MIDELVPKALDFYRWTEVVLGGTFFFPVEIARYLSHPEAKSAWEKRLGDPEYSAYISDRQDDILNELRRPYGILTGGYRLDTPGWIGAVRSFLQSVNLLELLETPYSPDNGVDKEYIVFATGAVDISFTSRIVPNKGEALLVRMPEWRIPTIIKEEIFIIPLTQKEYYWIGSYYDPLPESPVATEEGKDKLLAAIRKVYQGRLEVMAHYAGVRPTVNDRRPLIGLLPGTARHYIFNGMGTKGTSLAPYWADKLLSHISIGTPLPDEVSPTRYIPEPVYKSRL
jgi:hypothetical protein